MKIHPMGVKLFNVDGRMDRHTDITKLIVAFYIFVNVPNKNSYKI
jgi:hypothetical protein